MTLKRSIPVNLTLPKPLALTLTLFANGQAQVARAEAECRFELTRAIAKSMPFGVYDDVSKVVEATAAFADGYWAMFDYNRAYADDLETSGLVSL